MWPFKKRQPTEKSIPAEVEEYYGAERRERVGVAWLLAFATLVTTLLLAVALFFGGRWVYRRLANNDKPQVTPVITTPSSPSPAPAPAQSPQPSAPSANTPQTPPNPSSSSSSSSTPSTGKQTAQATDMPKTGPSETLATFVVVSIFATFGHHVYTRRKLVSQL